MCGKISVCVGEIISEADTWPLFEKWNRSQLYNITAIERQSDVNWIWAMTFLCSYSAERLSNFPFLSVSLPLSSVSVTLIFSFFLYHQLAHFLTIPNMYLLHPGPISFELILQHWAWSPLLFHLYQSHFIKRPFGEMSPSQLPFDVGHWFQNLDRWVSLCM